jgi:hypothetical protein
MIRYLERMVQLLFGMNRELIRDIHVSGALEHLRIVHVGDDRLILAREILVQRFDEFFTSNDGCRGF